MVNRQLMQMDSSNLLQDHHLLRSIERARSFAQEFSTRPVYSIRKNVIGATSISTAYRYLRTLESIGLVKLQRGKFEVKAGVISQPPDVLKSLLPSLLALKMGRRFGRSYNDSDIKFAMDKIENKFVTLDYAAWDLTKFQTPADLFMYVDNIEKTATFLKENGFSEGKRGHVVLLPKIGNFKNKIERIYLDSIANGGRSLLDAVAIELKHGECITVKGQFSTEHVIKVREDMPLENQT